MTRLDAVIDANDAFYRAMRRGDVQAMDALWARQRRVTCTHPSGPGIEGRAAVMESWRLILGEGAPVPVVCENPVAVITGETAMVLCEERIGDAVLIASNAWVREDGAWRMINHQAAEVRGTVR